MTSRTAAALVVAVAALAAAAPAAAEVYVPRGTTVEEIRVVGEDVRVDGVVRGSVWIVGGILTVGPGGEAWDVTVIAGAIRTAPGARLRGDVYHVGGSPPELGGSRIAVAFLAIVVVRALLVWLVAAAARALSGSRYLDALATRASEAPGRTLAAGALASVGALALALLLALTVVGIPVALMLIGVLVVGVTAGVALALRAIAPTARVRSVLAWLAIPFLGDALLALALALGVGSMLRWLGGGSLAAPPLTFRNE